MSGPWYQNNRQIKCPSLLPHAGPGNAPKGMFLLHYENFVKTRKAQFSLHWGRQCTTPNEVPNARLGDAPKSALLGLDGGVHAFFSIVSCWQCVKNFEGLGKVHSFHCIDGSSVPPPMSCQTLSQAMRQKARHLALAEAFICLLALVSGGNVWKNALHR